MSSVPIPNNYDINACSIKNTKTFDVGQRNVRDIQTSLNVRQKFSLSQQTHQHYAHRNKDKQHKLNSVAHYVQSCQIRNSYENNLNSLAKLTKSLNIIKYKKSNLKNEKHLLNKEQHQNNRSSDLMLNQQQQYSLDCNQTNSNASLNGSFKRRGSLKHDGCFDSDYLVFQELQTVVNDSQFSENNPSSYPETNPPVEQYTFNQYSSCNVLNHGFIQSTICLGSQNATHCVQIGDQSANTSQEKQGDDLNQNININQEYSEVLQILNIDGREQDTEQEIICKCDDEECFVNNYIRSASISVSSNQSDKQEQQLRDEVSKMRIESNGRQQRFSQNKKLQQKQQMCKQPPNYGIKFNQNFDKIVKQDENPQRSKSCNISNGDNMSHSVTERRVFLIEDSESAQQQQIIKILALMNSIERKITSIQSHHQLN